MSFKIFIYYILLLLLDLFRLKRKVQIVKHVSIERG